MPALQPVRGTQDLLPDEQRRHRAVTDTARAIAERYGYHEIATPIFEFTEVFARPIGETSDIVTKEMYTFADRGGEEVTLRPEYTAGIIRAVISNGLTQALPLRFFASGPMFRYERPQKGRFRQFHQIDVELIGLAQPQADVEVIALGADILDALGVLPRTVLELNTLGEAASRHAYREALVAYYRERRALLSADSLARLERNPLRILDSKDEGDRRVNAKAPSSPNTSRRGRAASSTRCAPGSTCSACRSARTRASCAAWITTGHTAFEFVTDDLGAQGTVLGGGRYDGLMGVMGGPETPGVGWAAGIERLALLIAEPPQAARPIAVIPVGDKGEAPALKLAHTLRRDGFTVELGYSGNVARRMKRANKIGARAAVILGEDELARDAATLRDLDTGEQIEVPLAELRDRLAPFR